MVAVGIEDGMIFEEGDPDFFVKDFHIAADRNENTPVFLFVGEEVRHAFGTENPATSKRS
jgi:hypothetical protein